MTEGVFYLFVEGKSVWSEDKVQSLVDSPGTEADLELSVKVELLDLHRCTLVDTADSQSLHLILEVGKHQL